MQKWLTLARRLDAINKNIGFIARWSVLRMLGFGMWNVIGRYIGVVIGYNLSSNRLIEAQWYLFDLIFLFGLGWTLQRESHVRVDILQTRWNEKRKAKFELIGTLFLLIPFALGVTLISIEPMMNSWLIGELSPDPNGLPRYWVKTFIPVGFLLLTLQGISQAIKAWFKLSEPSLLNKQFLDELPEKTID